MKKNYGVLMVVKMSLKQELCPSEMKYRVCSKRYDLTHKKKYSHFNQRPIKLIRLDDGSIKCVCRYSTNENDIKGVCWAKDIEEHNKAFHHDH